VISTLLLGGNCFANEPLVQTEKTNIHELDAPREPKEPVAQIENNKKPFANIYKNKPEEIGFSSSSYLEMMLALILIVALIIGLAWAVRRMNLPMMAGAGKMQVEASLSLGHKEKLLIVNIENQRLLLGATGAQITLIDRLAESSDAGKTKKDFSVKLKSIMGKRGE
jgi:flagellar protein FliO/FliZ